MVVMTEAATKYRMKNGKIFPSFTPPPLSFRVRQNANTKVMGIIARVRVSFTIVAASSTAVPEP